MEADGDEGERGGGGGEGRKREGKKGDTKVGSFYTSRFARVVPGGMGGAEFTRSGRPGKSNATIIGAELLAPAERGVGGWSRSDSSRPVAL